MVVAFAKSERATYPSRSGSQARPGGASPLSVPALRMLPERDARGVESLLEQVTLVQQAMGAAGVGIVGARRMVGLAPGQQGVLAGGVQACNGIGRASGGERGWKSWEMASEG